MAKRIGCRTCNSKDCTGCNVYTLATMLDNGKFDNLMDGYRTVVNPSDPVEVLPAQWVDKRFIIGAAIADVTKVVRCRDCKYWQDNNGGYPHDECRWGNGETPAADDFCSYGERKDT